MKKIIAFLLVLMLIPTIGFAKIEKIREESSKRIYEAGRSYYSTHTEENIEIQIFYMASCTYDYAIRPEGRIDFSTVIGVGIKGIEDKKFYYGVRDLKYQIDDGNKLSLKIIEDYKSKESPKPPNIKYDQEHKALVFGTYSDKMKKIRPDSKITFFVLISKDREVAVLLPPEIVKEWADLQKYKF